MEIKYFHSYTQYVIINILLINKIIEIRLFHLFDINT